MSKIKDGIVDAIHGAAAAACEAATGEIEAAGRIGSAVAEKERNAVTGTISGGKVIPEELFRQ